MLRFERVQEADFLAMADLRAEALQESLEALGRFDPVRVRERLRAAFVPEYMQHIAQGERRIGYLTLIPQPGKPELRLHHLYIQPAHQGKGAGTWAMAWAKGTARTQQRDITLCALRGSAANRFYVRQGFQVVEEQEFDFEYRWSPSFETRGDEVIA